MQRDSVWVVPPHVFSKPFAVGALLLGCPGAFAGSPPCEVHYQQDGNLIGGPQFSTWDVVANVPLAVAFKRITVEAVKSGLSVAHSDVELGILSFTQANAGVTNTGQQVNLPWTVTIESAATGLKITVSKTAPGGYATSEDFQIASMCAVIDAARNP